MYLGWTGKVIVLAITPLGLATHHATREEENASFLGHSQYWFSDAGLSTASIICLRA